MTEGKHGAAEVAPSARPEAGAPKQKWGPALLPGPTAPSLSLPVFGLVRLLGSEDPSRSTRSILARPLRRRAGFIRPPGRPDDSPILVPRRPESPCDLPIGCASVCLARSVGSEDPQALNPLASAVPCPGPSPHRRFLAKANASAPVRSGTRPGDHRTGKPVFRSLRPPPVRSRPFLGRSSFALPLPVLADQPGLRR